jgi:flagellar biosynthesis protein FlhF
MQVKKFKAETFEGALKEVKRQMGSSAVILSKKTVKRPGGGPFSFLDKSFVELTAAVDRRLKTGNETSEKVQVKENQTPESTPIIGKAAKDDVVSLSKAAMTFGAKKRARLRSLNKKYIEIDEEDNIDELIAKEEEKNHNKNMKSIIQKSPARFDEFAGGNSQSIFSGLSDPVIANTPKALKKVCLTLNLSGVDGKYIDEVVSSVTENMNPLLIKKENYLESYVAKTLMDKMNFSGGLQLYNHGPKLALIMGSTGVGKSTTIAKLVSEYKRRNKLVGVITLDVHKIGAVEQLTVFSNILDFPLKIVSKMEDFPLSIQELKNMDLILIDSAGRGKKEGESISDMKKIININMPVEKYICLSSCMRDSDALSSFNRFSVVGIDKIIFTKMDETSVYGGIYNIMRKTGVPVSYFTTGQRVPEDIEVGTKERLIDLILKLSGN